MKIFAHFFNFHRKLMPFITAVGLMVPAKTAKEAAVILPDLAHVVTLLPQKCGENLNAKALEGLKFVCDTNFRGGVTHRFDENSVKTLKMRILKPEDEVKYKAPIENSNNVYLEPFGMFFAKRPDGKKSRPHLGLDIFVSKFSRKPKTPVLVQAPLDGVVIAHKRAREKDNVIANAVVMLGVDGRRYAFDHLARPTDYKDSVALPTVGKILKAGDPIGYVGSTGETSMWHLHFSVMTDEMLEKQMKDKFWLDLAARTQYATLKGQVDPLNFEDAGPIAKLINQYRR